ncbi:fimbrillin family protein [Bacteroides sp. 51]|uniref:fimbrillin family protein n=1 Tax=Bacteroides sp. 51 TaxID=2302938 RepID=UPI0013D17B2D|nr:fimbrillin family protein [Bacteroides sp. 51]
MRKNKLIYLVFLLLPGFISCADDDNDNHNIDAGDSQVHLQATVAKNNILTRATEPAVVGDYYLHYTAVGGTSLSVNKFTCSSSDGGLTTAWSATPTLYWDDIKKATPKDDTEFYLTNVESMIFPSKSVDKDILFGKETGWNETLDFTLNHLTSKITVIVYDNTLNKDNAGKVNFSNAKVVFNPGLNRTTIGIDYATSKINSLPADKDKATTIERTGFTDRNDIEIGVETYNGVESDPLYIVPQTFTKGDSLEVTAGKYVYRIPVPIPSGESFSLGAGEHLTIQVELTEDVITATAKLIGWEDKPAGKIEISRVFNIASWNELRDLAQAIATGYTFKGMVVRLMADIELKGQISLGTEEYPFEGIFGGNGYKIKDLGIYQGEGMRRNKGGLFAYTRGATIQNLTLVAPYVESDGENPVGALIDNATNTTVFNCRTESKTEGGYSGDVNGGAANKVGGLIGTATGTSTLINCYSYVRVEGKGEYIGGLIGYSEASITHCFAKGEIDCAAGTLVGGLAGYMAGSMQYCYAQGKVTGYSKVGGLVGELDGEVSQCYSSGRAAGSEAGGLFGSLGFDADAKNCFWFNYDGNTPGSGSAALPNCKSYTNGVDLLNPSLDYLDNITGIWKTPVDTYPEFANL